MGLNKKTQPVSDAEFTKMKLHIANRTGIDVSEWATGYPDAGMFGYKIPTGEVYVTRVYFDIEKRFWIKTLGRHKVSKEVFGSTSDTLADNDNFTLLMKKMV